MVNDIEMRTLSESDVSEVLFEVRVPQESEGTAFKRFKTNCLNYITQNYLRIIYSLFIIMLFMFIVVGLLLFLIFKPINAVEPIGREALLKEEIYNNQIKKLLDIINSNAKLPYSDGPESLVRNAASEDVSAVEAKTSEKPYVNIPMTAIPCNNVVCTGEYCTIKELKYQSFRLAACCDCFPKEITLIRYEYSELYGVNLIFTSTNNLSLYSDFDLKYIEKPLKSIEGIWTISIENEKKYFLVYRQVKITVEPDQPDE